MGLSWLERCRVHRRVASSIPGQGTLPRFRVQSPVRACTGGTDQINVSLSNSHSPFLSMEKHTLRRGLKKKETRQTMVKNICEAAKDLYQTPQKGKERYTPQIAHEDVFTGISHPQNTNEKAQWDATTHPPEWLKAQRLTGRCGHCWECAMAQPRGKGLWSLCTSSHTYPLTQYFHSPLCTQETWKY